MQKNDYTEELTMIGLTYYNLLRYMLAAKEEVNTTDFFKMMDDHFELLSEGFKADGTDINDYVDFLNKEYRT